MTHRNSVSTIMFYLYIAIMNNKNCKRTSESKIPLMYVFINVNS